MGIFLDHIGIATHNLNDSSPFWELLGLMNDSPDECVIDQGVTTRFFSTTVLPTPIPPPMVELLEPTSENTPIGKFLRNRGPGIQQICFRVDNLVEMLTKLRQHGVQLIDEVPRKGAHGKLIAFVHPSSTGGVLVELTQSNQTE